VEKNDFQKFMLREVSEAIKNYPDNIIKISNIAGLLEKKFTGDGVLFHPRRIGHYVRQLGYKTFRFNDGYRIFRNKKTLLHELPR